MADRYKIVVSDFHIGKGHRKGYLNYWEGFNHDQKFAELLQHYSTDYFEDEEVELVVNGDFFDFQAVEVDGSFPDRITDAIALRKVEACIAGHPLVFKALREFAGRPRKSVTVLPGNHDIDLVFLCVQERFCQEIVGEPVDARVRFIIDRDSYCFDGIEIHHGHQFESVHNFDYQNLILTKGTKEPILNLPWGCIFYLDVVMPLVDRRPWITRVHPFSKFLSWSIVFDPIFAIRVILKSIYHFVKTRFIRAKWHWANFRHTMRIVSEFSVFTSLEQEARHLLDAHAETHTVIFGHDHFAKVRQFGPNKQYVNTGTWTDLISLELGDFGRSNRLTFALIEYLNGEGPIVSLKEWHGYHDMVRDVNF